MQYEVSMTVYGQDSKSKKGTKMAAIYKLQVIVINILSVYTRDIWAYSYTI